MGQDFRSPVILESNPSNYSQPAGQVIQGVFQPARNGATISLNDGFVPNSSGEGLGLVPVRPRTGKLGINGVQNFRPDYSSGRTASQERIIDQIRADNFDVEDGTSTNQAGPQTIRQRYEDGRDQLVRQVIQDEEGNYYNHGPWRLYNRRGEIVATGQFVDGYMDGTWERWHSKNSSQMFQNQPFTQFEGPFVSNATFKNGKLHGVWVISDRGRQKIVEVPYRNGKRHGTATWWFPNSERMRVINFKDGALDGPMMEWNKELELVRNDEFINGQKVIRRRTMYRPKQPSSESYFLDAELSLEEDDNWWDAEPAEYVQVGSRVQHGPTYAWHDNGQRKMVGHYRDDVRVGKFFWWHSNGQKALTGNYEEGSKKGIWKWWHANGMKSIQGMYEGDQPVGVWTWWDENGRVKDREDFGDDSTGLLVDPGNAESDAETSEQQDPTSDQQPPELDSSEMEEISPLDPVEFESDEDS